MTSSRGPPSCLIQFFTLCQPLSAAFHHGCLIVSWIRIIWWWVCFGFICTCIGAVGYIWDTSNGINLAIGWLVFPCAVLILAAHNSPSFASISSSISASFRVILGVSLCTRTISLVSIFWLLIAVARRCSLIEVNLMFPTWMKLAQEECL